MKTFILMSLMILAAESAFSVTPLMCNYHKPLNELSIEVDSGSVVEVQGRGAMSGHTWKSVDGFKAKTIRQAKLGGVFTEAFYIDTRNQNERAKTYTFLYKRSWETTVVSECRVTVVRK